MVVAASVGERPTGSRLWTVARIGIFALLACWAALSLAIVFRLARRGVFTGADGVYTGDQLQYLAWIRDAGRHGLAATLFDVAPIRHDYLHPMFLLSGVLWRLGLSLPLSYLMWKPIAIVALGAGVCSYARRFFPGDRRVLVVAFLALFFYTPAAPIAHHFAIGSSRTVYALGFIGGEAFPAGLLWGYLPSAIAVGLLPVFLLGIEGVAEPLRRASGRGASWYVAQSSLAGILVSWLHPWQGLTLLVLTGAGLLSMGLWRRWRSFAIPLAALVAPLGYYVALSNTDRSWMIARAQTIGPRWPIYVLVLGLAPIVLPAMSGVGAFERNLGERLLLLWFPSALLVYFLVNSFPFHAFEGTTIPLAVLAARGWTRWRLPAVLGVVGVLAITVPGALFTVAQLRDAIFSTYRQPWFITREEAAALHFVDRSDVHGGVLSTVYLGVAAPSLTDRSTWVGHPSHTPQFNARAKAAESLFDGALSPGDARSLVRRSGAAFVVSDCAHRYNLTDIIRPILVRVRAFGCAVVYEVALAGHRASSNRS